MSKFLDELRKLPRFTSPKGVLFPANDGELVEVGSVISLFRSIESDLNAEIESLKAITELAVEGFKHIQSLYMQWIDSELDFDFAASCMDDVAQNTLVEIARLQNDSTS